MVHGLGVIEALQSEFLAENRIEIVPQPVEGETRAGHERGRTHAAVNIKGRLPMRLLCRHFHIAHSLVKLGFVACEHVMQCHGWQTSEKLALGLGVRIFAVEEQALIARA